MTPPSGLLLVDKPIGPTSHDVVGRARYLLGTKKIGHAGTLDPMASGLLLLGVERGTKLLGHLALKDKVYTATIRLGQATSTEDAQGEILSTDDASRLSRAEITTAMASLTGAISQVPSAVSAIKVDGKRSYERVRAGEQVVLTARDVTISAFDLQDLRAEGPLLDIDVTVECSTGTYIRALARDLGAKLGVGAHLTALRRTRIGPFSVGDTANLYPGDVPIILPGHAAVARGQRPPRPPVDPHLRADLMARIQSAVAVARQAFPVHLITPAEMVEIGYGRPIPPIGIVGTYALLDPTGERLVALAVDEAHRARPLLVWGNM